MTSLLGTSPPPPTPRTLPSPIQKARSGRTPAGNFVIIWNPFGHVPFATPLHATCDVICLGIWSLDADFFGGGLGIRCCVQIGGIRAAPEGPRRRSGQRRPRASATSRLSRPGLTPPRRPSLTPPRRRRRRRDRSRRARRRARRRGAGARRPRKGPATAPVLGLGRLPTGRHGQ